MLQRDKYPSVLKGGADHQLGQNTRAHALGDRNSERDVMTVNGYHGNGVPEKLIRDVTLRALCPNSLFSKVGFS
jgi:hypothetical protein